MNIENILFIVEKQNIFFKLITRLITGKWYPYHFVMLSDLAHHYEQCLSANGITFRTMRMADGTWTDFWFDELAVTTMRIIA